MESCSAVLQALSPWLGVGPLRGQMSPYIGPKCVFMGQRALVGPQEPTYRVQCTGGSLGDNRGSDAWRGWGGGAHQWARGPSVAIGPHLGHYFGPAPWATAIPPEGAQHPSCRHCQGLGPPKKLPDRRPKAAMARAHKTPITPASNPNSKIGPKVGP